MALPPTAEKIIHTTLNAEGVPTVSSRGEEDCPAIAIVRGTVGQGDHCVPLRNWPLDGQPNPATSSRFVSLEEL